MMKYYPTCLNIQDKRCVVIGGGEVGERKVERLIEGGAAVVVVDRLLTPLLNRMKRGGKIIHIEDDYRETYLDGAFLVIGATDRGDVNERIAGDARRKGILINIVDDPGKCDFTLPALLQRGDLVIAVSTEGKSPALARKVRDELESHVGPEYEALVEIMGRLRDGVMARGLPPEDNKKMFEAVVNSDIAQCIREKNWDAVKKIIHDMTDVDLAVGD